MSEHWIALIVAVLGVVAALLENRGKKKAAGALSAVIEGVDEFRKKNNGSGDAVAAEIKAKAEAKGVQVDVDAAVKKTRRLDKKPL